MWMSLRANATSGSFEPLSSDHAPRWTRVRIALQLGSSYPSPHDGACVLRGGILVTAAMRVAERQEGGDKVPVPPPPGLLTEDEVKTAMKTVLEERELGEGAGGRDSPSRRRKVVSFKGRGDYQS